MIFPYTAKDREPAKLIDIFLPLAMAGAATSLAFTQLHFSNEHGAQNALHENGYRSINIHEGPSWRRSDCNGLYLTHYTATDKNGIRHDGTICQSVFDTTPIFLPK